MRWLTRIGRGLAKVAVALAAVAAIAAAIVTLHPGAERGSAVGIKEASADIAWLADAGRNHTQRFASSLEELGHTPPRVYDLSGNTVYTSSRTTRKSPAQVLYAYQHKFATNEVNSRIHTKTPASIARLDSSSGTRSRLGSLGSAAMSGEIVPSVIEEDFVSMSGLLLKSGDRKMSEQVDEMEETVEKLERAYRECGGASQVLRRELDPESYLHDTTKDLGRAMTKNSGKCSGAQVCSEVRRELTDASRKLQAYVAAIEKQPQMSGCRGLKRVALGTLNRAADAFSDRIDAVRSIRAKRREGSDLTHVTAVWSERGFEMSRLGKGDDERPRRAGRSEFPVCSHCERGWNFGGNGAESDYSSNVVWSDRSVSETAASYRRLLHRRGWRVRTKGSKSDAVRRAIGAPSGEGEWLRFTKGDKHLTLHAHPHQGDHRTEVTAFTSD